MALGRLAFERAGAATAVCGAYAESPLRFLTPRNHGRAAWAYTTTLGGGLVDGDRVRLEIAVGKSARAFVSTQGPTRVFRSLQGCSSETVARVEEGGALVLLPEPSACFGGARYQQRTEVQLASGASLALWEILSAGRERWGFARCKSALVVRPFLDEVWLLDAAHGSLEARMGRFHAIGTLLLAGPLFAGIAERVRSEVDAQPVAKGAPLIESASPLRDGALVVRAAAESVQALLRRLRALLADVPSLLGDDPWRHDASHAS